ncbi:MAG: proline--tRNA ligase [Gammaproteobacteria bacterium]|nr:proline--tRNA ligase [Gammaproteobacteria bacterium]
MHLTKIGFSTLKEDPADAEIVSHKLMLRAGLIKKLSPGIFTWMPIGLRVIKNVESIVREEMNKAGGIELLMPAIQPAELWKESGRWDEYGSLLLQIKDRHDRDFCFGPTHEEVITDIARKELKSYKQLPIIFYQIQTKFRDEIRPRFGVMRSREFIMKDAYSFHANQDSLDEGYNKMHDAYSSIFTRLELKYRVVDADGGEIGGSRSQEFHVIADSGEDAIAYCEEANFASNIEMAETYPPEGKMKSPTQDLAKVNTPDVNTIEELCKSLNIKSKKTIKTLIVEGSDGPCALVLRGDHELNALKASKLPGILSPLKMSDSAKIEKATGKPLGSLGPINLGIKTYFDHATLFMHDFACGANEKNRHFTGVNFGRDLDYQKTVDIRNVVEGDPAPNEKGTLRIARGIEVGHIFQLGTKYSDSLNAKIKSSEGNDISMTMGCYGIGITRIIAAAIEQNHDERGIIWPEPLAPFDVIIIAINIDKSEKVKKTADALYQELREIGIDAIYDDRLTRPGIKFAEAELIGIPHRIVVSEKVLSMGKLEYQSRKDTKAVNLRKDEIIKLLRK